MNYLELIGYIASLLIAVSLMMTSILKLRWINLAGSATYTFYGFAIGSLPVAFMNMFIMGVNIYQLAKIYRKIDDFKILEVSAKDKLLVEFLEYYQDEIKTYFPNFFYKGDDHDVQYLILRNMDIAGVFLGTRCDRQTLAVDMDYVIPAYQDFEPGKFLYHSAHSKLHESPYYRLISYPDTKHMKKYFSKMGFRPQEKNSDEEMELLVSNQKAD